MAGIDLGTFLYHYGCNVQENEPPSLYMWDMTRRKRNVSYRHITIENVCEFFFLSPNAERTESYSPPSTTEACDAGAIRGVFLLTPLMARKPLHRDSPLRVHKVERCALPQLEVSRTVSVRVRDRLSRVWLGINMDLGRFLLPWDPNA